MTHAPRLALAAAAALAVACGADPGSRDAAAGRAALTALQATEHAVAAGSGAEATPALGGDDRGPFVVYASRPALEGGGLGPSAVWYQRLRDGAPEGAAVRVSAFGTDDELDDASGRYVVYTAWDSAGSLSGRIVVYDVATAASLVVARADVVQEARIAGTRVAWLQGYAGEATLFLHDLATGTTAWIAGPDPSPDEIDIGDRFLVWTELSGAQGDVRAYDLAARTRRTVTARGTVDERLPSTDGPWVAFEARPIDGSAKGVELVNLETGEHRVVPGRGAIDAAPSVSGELVAYESRLGGSGDVLVYRLSAGDTFPVTSDPWDQRAVDVAGGLVAWVDARLGTPDVYVATLAFTDDPGGGIPPGDDLGPAAALEAAAAAVGELHLEAFARPELKAVLLAKLGAVRRMLDAGAPGAAKKLERDIVAKTDGCAVAGAPDANDWIADCAAQASVREALRRAVDALRRAASGPRGPAGLGPGAGRGAGGILASWIE